MDANYLLLTTLQLTLTSGVGTVSIVAYATRGIFVKEENPVDNGPKFASDYDELMWLAERQKHHLDKEETRRFFQLRRSWPEMHSLLIARYAV